MLLLEQEQRCRLASVLNYSHFNVRSPRVKHPHVHVVFSCNLVQLALVGLVRRIRLVDQFHLRFFGGYHVLFLGLNIMLMRKEGRAKEPTLLSFNRV